MAHASAEGNMKDTQAKWDRQRKQAEDLCKELGIDYPDCGFYIGDGWFPVVAEALRGIGQIGLKWKLGQVKQKFCQLRIYAEFPGGEWEESHPDHDKYEAAKALIGIAEAACDVMCEGCGAVVDGGPACGCKLCDTCRKDRDA
jgi:hypothetical protein